MIARPRISEWKTAERGAFEVVAPFYIAPLLAAGEPRRLLARGRVVAVLERRDDRVDARGEGRGRDLGAARRRLHAVGDVLVDRPVEERRLLLDDADAPPVLEHVQRVEGHAVDEHAAPLRVVEPQQQLREGRLAAAARADERRRLAGLEAQRDALDGEGRVGPRQVVAERDVLEDDEGRGPDAGVEVRAAPRHGGERGRERPRLRRGVVVEDARVEDLGVARRDEVDVALRGAERLRRVVPRDDEADEAAEERAERAAERREGAEAQALVLPPPRGDDQERDLAAADDAVGAEAHADVLAERGPLEREALVEPRRVGPGLGGLGAVRAHRRVVLDALRRARERVRALLLELLRELLREERADAVRGEEEGHGAHDPPGQRPVRAEHGVAAADERRGVARDLERGVADEPGRAKRDSTSLRRECSARARSGESIHASRPFREMIARPKISRNEWKTAERGAFGISLSFPAPRRATTRPSPGASSGARRPWTRRGSGRPGA